LVSAFKQHGFPELASENDFGGPKFIKATQEELSMLVLLIYDIFNPNTPNN
jgi:hypothetical protein